MEQLADAEDTVDEDDTSLVIADDEALLLDEL